MPNLLVYSQDSMPKSRKRKGAKKYRPKVGLRTEVSRFFEEIGLDRERPVSYPVLYHYTSTAAALAILDKQQFRSTAHDCTNDTHELNSANSVVFDVAQRCLKNASGLARECFQLFLDKFYDHAIGKIRKAYLSCFSVARDDAKQWVYGDKSRGVCLGVKILNESPPKDPAIFSMQCQVIYSEEAVRDWVSDAFSKISQIARRYPSTVKNIQEVLFVLRSIAAFAAIVTKAPQWSDEKEVRHVTMDRFESGVTPEEYMGSDGKVKQCIFVPLRKGNKLMALDEIIIGTDQDTKATRQKLEAMLASKGYTPGMIEYPRITISAVSKADARESAQSM